jgi:hypothetical protein
MAAPSHAVAAGQIDTSALNREGSSCGPQRRPLLQLFPEHLDIFSESGVGLREFNGLGHTDRIAPPEKGHRSCVEPWRFARQGAHYLIRVIALVTETAPHGVLLLGARMSFPF